MADSKEPTGSDMDVNVQQTRRDSGSENTLDAEPDIVEAHEEEKPTVSHQLADENQPEEQQGLAQLDHGEIEVKNMGWNEDQDKIPSKVVGGLGNEELWAMVRRFNKV